MNKMGEILNSHTVRIERLFPGTCESVFAYFSNPEYISKWLMRCSMQPELGGLVSLTSDPIPEGTLENDNQPPHEIVNIGLISEFEPGRIIAFSWNEYSYNQASVLKVELEIRGEDQILVILTHSHLDPEFMAAVAAGWHTHLETLLALLKGEKPSEFYPRFNQLLEEYKVVVAGAGIVILSSTASPAVASELSDSAYKAVIAQKQQLLYTYDKLWKDADRISVDISTIEKMSQRDDRVLDSLHRDLKEKKDDLKKIEFDIRDLDKVLAS